MNFIEKLNLKKAIIIFVGAIILNFAINFALFNFKYLPEIIAEYQKIADFFQKQVNDKNIDLKITKSGIEINKDSYLIESKDFPIQLNPTNIIYIAKNANYSDFKEKNTIAILNDKELVLNLNNSYQNISLENMLGTNEEFKIDRDTTKVIIESFFNQNMGLKGYLYFAFTIEKVLYYFAQFIWGFYILAFVIFYVLKFSGYKLEKNLIKIPTTIYFALILSLEPIFFYFKLSLGIFYVLFLGFVGITLYLKLRLDKEAKIEPIS